MTDTAAGLAEIDRGLEGIRGALRAVKESNDLLTAALEWSSYDTWFGGIIASATKREAIHKVERSLWRVDDGIRNVRRQVTDADIQVLGELGIGPGSGLLDVWFDNFITDLFVGRRLTKVAERLGAARRELTALQSELIRRRGELESTA